MSTYVAGLLWKRRQSVPRILRSSERDALVLLALFTVQGGKKFRRREANVLIANAVDIAAKTINDEDAGMRPEEGILEYLARAGTFSEFGQALPENIWSVLLPRFCGLLSSEFMLPSNQSKHELNMSF
jgi:hypothetical protein